MVETKDDTIDAAKKNWADEDDDQDDEDEGQDASSLPTADDDKKDEEEKKEEKKEVRQYNPVKRERNQYGDFIVDTIKIREVEVSKVAPGRENDDDEDDESSDDDDDEEEKKDEPDEPEVKQGKSHHIHTRLPT